MTVVGASRTGVAKFASTLTLKTYFEDFFFYSIPVSDMTCFTEEVLRAKGKYCDCDESGERFLIMVHGVIEDF